MFFATAAAIASGAETVYKEIIYIIEKKMFFNYYNLILLEKIVVEMMHHQHENLQDFYSFLKFLQVLD